MYSIVAYYLNKILNKWFILTYLYVLYTLYTYLGYFLAPCSPRISIAGVIQVALTISANNTWMYIEIRVKPVIYVYSNKIWYLIIHWKKELWPRTFFFLADTTNSCLEIGHYCFDCIDLQINQKQFRGFFNENIRNMEN